MSATSDFQAPKLGAHYSALLSASMFIVSSILIIAKEIKSTRMETWFVEKAVIKDCRNFLSHIKKHGNFVVLVSMLSPDVLQNRMFNGESTCVCKTPVSICPIWMSTSKWLERQFELMVAVTKENKKIYQRSRTQHNLLDIDWSSYSSVIFLTMNWELP